MTNNLFLDFMNKTINFDTVIDEIKLISEEKCTCEKHGEYLQKNYSDGSKTICPKCAEDENKELREKREAEIDAEIERQKKNNKIKYFKKCNVSPEFYFTELSDYIPKTKAQEEAKKAVKEMIETGKGKIIMLGSNGAGKTMLANIACQHLGGKIYTMYEISAMIRQAYTPKAEKSELEIVNEISELPFLVIDEIGRVTSSDALQNWFSFILDKRHANKRPTILIGNLHFKKDCENKGCPKCFENYFDNDILSRFHEETTVINIKCQDERKEKQSMKYFTD